MLVWVRKGRDTVSTCSVGAVKAANGGLGK